MGRMARWNLAVDRILRGRRPALRDLVAALDEVNPTPHDLDPDEREARYAAKARLQTRLIELYPHELELRADGEQWVLGLRGGRDAKHVVRSQLGESVQDWFSAEILRLEEKESSISLPRRALSLAKVGPTATVNEVDERMSEGDYEGATVLLEPRAARGDVAAALQMLELLVDYLDQPELAATSAEHFPRSVLSEPEVTSLLALALVRCGRLEEAERTLRSLEGASTARAWEELARAHLARQDAANARKAADRLEASDRSRLSAADAIRQEAAAMLASGLAIELEQLQSALQQLRWDDAERAAQAILERDPASREGREALGAISRARAAEAQARSFAEGESLARAGRWRDAAAAYRSAMGHPTAQQRAAEADERARALARERAVQEGVSALGEDVNALAAYARLSDDLRAEVYQRSPAALKPVLDWIEAVPTGRPEQRAALARALLLASDKLAAERPEEALAVLEPHAELAAKGRAARELLQACRDAVARREHARASALLDQAAASAEGPLEEARRHLAAVPLRALDAAGRERHAALAHRLAERADEAGRVRDFERLVDSDPLGALRLTRGRDEAAWLDRERLARDAVRSAFRVHDLSLDAATHDIAAPFNWTAPLVGLDLSAGSCWLAEPCGRWLALAELPLGVPRVRRGILLYTGHRTTIERCHLVGGGEAWVTSLSRATRLDLRRGEPVERIGPEAPGHRLLWVVPASNGTWCRGRGDDRWAFWPHAGTSSRQGDLVEVVALTGAGEAVGRTRDGDLFRLGADGQRSRLGTSNATLLAATAHPTDPRGAVLTLEASKSEVLVVAFAGGRDTLLARRAIAAPTRTRQIVAASARQTGLVYLLEPLPGRGMTLSGLTAEGATRFAIPIATESALVVDPLGTACAIAVQGAEGLCVLLLQEDAPELPPLAPMHSPPPFEDGCDLEDPPGEDPWAGEFEWDDGTLDERVEQLLALFPEDPSHRAKVATALLNAFPERGARLVQRLDLDPRDDVALALALAKERAERRAYPEVARLLEGLDPMLLPTGLRRHFWHLRAEAALVAGQTGEARGHLHMGRLESGSCPVEQCLTWADRVERSEPTAPQPEDAGTASWWEIRGAVTEAERLLEQGDPVAARLRLDEGVVARAREPEVVLARGRIALADPSMPLWSRLRALARCDNPFGHSALMPGLGSAEEHERIEAAAVSWTNSASTEPALPRR